MTLMAGSSKQEKGGILERASAAPKYGRTEEGEMATCKVS